MGSFDVACGISNLGISEGDEVGFTILDNGENYWTERAGYTNHGVAYLSDVFTYHKPFLTPVYGVYSDYGSLKKVEKNATAIVLEKFFGLPVSTIVKCVASDRELHDSYNPIFDAYAKPEAKKALNDHNADPVDTLKALGFTEVPSESGEKVLTYGNYIFTSKDERSWLVTVKDEFGGATRKLFDTYRGLESMLDTLGEKADVYPCYREDMVENAKRLRNMSGMFFLKEVFQEMSSYLVENGDSLQMSISNRDEQAIRPMLDILAHGSKEERNPYASIEMMNGTDALKRYVTFHSQDLDYLAEYSGNDELFDAFKLRNLMKSVNRVFMPTFLGTQHSDEGVLMELNKVTDEIMAERKKRFEEWV